MTHSSFDRIIAASLLTLLACRWWFPTADGSNRKSTITNTRSTLCPRKHCGRPQKSPLRLRENQVLLTNNDNTERERSVFWVSNISPRTSCASLSSNFEIVRKRTGGDLLWCNESRRSRRTDYIGSWTISVWVHFDVWGRNVCLKNYKLSRESFSSYRDSHWKQHQLSNETKLTRFKTLWRSVLQVTRYQKTAEWWRP